MASVFGYEEQVMEALWSEPDGLKPADLLRRFWSARWEDVNLAIHFLKRRGLVVEVTRTHGSAQSERDHKRIMVLKSGGIK